MSMWANTQTIIIGKGLKISREDVMEELQGMNFDNEEPQVIKEMAMVTMRQKVEESMTIDMIAEILEDIRQRESEEKVLKVLHMVGE